MVGCAGELWTTHNDFPPLGPKTDITKKIPAHHTEVQTQRQIYPAFGNNGEVRGRGKREGTTFNSRAYVAGRRGFDLLEGLGSIPECEAVAL